MVRLIDANALIRCLNILLPSVRDCADLTCLVYHIDNQPYILIDKVNTLDEIKQRGVFVARKEK